MPLTAKFEAGRTLSEEIMQNAERLRPNEKIKADSPICF